MDSPELSAAFSDLSTALIADGCVRVGARLGMAPPGIAPVVTGWRAAGRVLPARHSGSVDVFLEAIGEGLPGDLLVVDNNGRRDEGCIGDLTVLEARAGRLGGALVWGLHRDTLELVEIGFPVWSYGRCPAGPLRLDPARPERLASARFGDLTVDRDWAAFADDDGVVFTPVSLVGDVLAAAKEIRTRERRQAGSVRNGTTLREQLRFGEYLARRAREPELSFRRHLREIGGAIEE